MVQASPSHVPPPPLISAQFPSPKSAPSPFSSDTIASWKHTSSPSAAKLTLKRTALPGGISVPDMVNPTKVLPLKLIENSAAAEVPPDIELIFMPGSSIWKPATGIGLSITTSKEFEVTLLKLRLTGSQLLPSPSHTPQGSSSASPPHSPAQSSTLPSQSHSPSPIPSPLHTPHSSTSEPSPSAHSHPSLADQQEPSSILASES